MIGVQRVLVVLTSALVTASLVAAGSGTLRIQVRDSEGAVLESSVIIRPDGAGRQQAGDTTVVSAMTDRQGRLVKELEPGFFDVCVMSDAFVPTCQKVRIAAGSMTAIAVRLKIDAGVIRETGDTFPTKPR